MSTTTNIHGIPIEHTVFSYREPSRSEHGYSTFFYSPKVQEVLRYAFSKGKTGVHARHRIQEGAFAGSIVVHEIHLPTMTIHSRSEPDHPSMTLLVEDIRVKRSNENNYEYATHLRRTIRKLKHKNRMLRSELSDANRTVREINTIITERVAHLYQLHLDGMDQSEEGTSDSEDSSLYGRS